MGNASWCAQGRAKLMLKEHETLNDLGLYKYIDFKTSKSESRPSIVSYNHILKSRNIRFKAPKMHNDDSSNSESRQSIDESSVWMDNHNEDTLSQAAYYDQNSIDIKTAKLEGSFRWPRMTYDKQSEYMKAICEESKSTSNDQPENESFYNKCKTINELIINESEADGKHDKHTTPLKMKKVKMASASKISEIEYTEIHSHQEFMFEDIDSLDAKLLNKYEKRYRFNAEYIFKLWIDLNNRSELQNWKAKLEEPNVSWWVSSQGTSLNSNLVWTKTVAYIDEWYSFKEIVNKLLDISEVEKWDNSILNSENLFKITKNSFVQRITYAPSKFVSVINPRDYLCKNIILTVNNDPGEEEIYEFSSSVPDSISPKIPGVVRGENIVKIVRLKTWNDGKTEYTCYHQYEPNYLINASPFIKKTISQRTLDWYNNMIKALSSS